METVRDRVRSRNHKKRLLIFIAIISSLLAIYIGISIYFINHFNIGSKINGVNVAGYTEKQVHEELASSIKEYKLILEGRDGERAEITSKDIELDLINDGSIEEFLHKQNPFTWIKGLFKGTEYKINEGITYNEEKLLEYFNNFSLNDGQELIEPQNAYLNYNNGKYEIVKEVRGNKVAKEKLLERVKAFITSGKERLNLEEEKCYEDPLVTTKSEELINCQSELNKYISSKITYGFGNNSYTFDGDIIHNWLVVKDNYDVEVNRDKVSVYVDELAGIFNTYGDTRAFKTSNNSVINISNGDYGWIVDKTATIEEIVELVKSGQEVSIKPKFAQEAASASGNDYGNSYVEIDLSRQHLWVYVNGSLVVDSELVSGSMNYGWGTPGGVYSLKYKELNAVLRGEGYETPVSYWMPFNNNIGMHDATWRDAFGGDIYLNNGSHGCINLPYDKAKILYEKVYSGMPVICYYEDIEQKKNEEPNAV